MDDLTVMQSFRAERDADPTETRVARESIGRALEGRMDAAAELASPPRPAGTRPGLGRPGLFSRRRRLLAFAGTVTAAAVVAAALVLDSGPTTQPASAAEILHEAAASAVVTDAPATLIPGPGQFLYRKEQRLSVEGWRYPLPAEEGNRPLMTTGGTMQGPDVFNALMPTTAQSWTGPDGSGRRREVAGTPQILGAGEEARWQAAGSPLPPPFNTEYQDRFKATAYPDALELGPGVVDTRADGFGNYRFPDTSKLPTEPEALRHQVEANAIEVSGFNLMYPKAKHLDAEQTIEELINVLFEGNPSPRLQATIFNALAEVPGIEVTEATDSLGRQGDAIRFAPEEGVRREYLFDPETSDLLANRGVLVDPAASRSYKDLPAGTTIAERDFIEAAVVDSTDETGLGAEARASGR
ncbi:MAG TPA: CU044_5270 family protein [Solirubrobacterales bacterium]|nr:CU044_5270 family protein [Solirubrobacterales bacterium]